ncbi:hypothetical protein FB451DRAFT_1164449 [Mycena latifolia]|nr:hypothetical protein FB451DRAFT_1164449 [Mycena latifolia]
MDGRYLTAISSVRTSKRGPEGGHRTSTVYSKLSPSYPRRRYIICTTPKYLRLIADPPLLVTSRPNLTSTAAKSAHSPGESSDPSSFMRQGLFRDDPLKALMEEEEEDILYEQSPKQMRVKSDKRVLIQHGYSLVKSTQHNAARSTEEEEVNLIQTRVPAPSLNHSTVCPWWSPPRTNSELYRKYSTYHQVLGIAGGYAPAVAPCSQCPDSPCEKKEETSSKSRQAAGWKSSLSDSNRDQEPCGCPVFFLDLLGFTNLDHWERGVGYDSQEEASPEEHVARRDLMQTARRHLKTLAAGFAEGFFREFVSGGTGLEIHVERDPRGMRSSNPTWTNLSASPILRADSTHHHRSRPGGPARLIVPSRAGPLEIARVFAPFGQAGQNQTPWRNRGGNIIRHPDVDAKAVLTTPLRFARHGANRGRPLRSSGGRERLQKSEQTQSRTLAQTWRFQTVFEITNAAMVDSPTALDSKPTSSSPDEGSPSAHAAAQAQYRMKNATAEKEKAKLRMRRLCQERKAAQDERDEVARQEYEEFRQYCDLVKPFLLHYDRQNPAQVAEFERLLATNPCVADFGPMDEDYLEFLFHQREGRFPEWREELADYQDIITEYTPEELDAMQLEARAKLPNKCIILARGGF